MNTVNLAVVGSPIAHSLSPHLHLAAYAALGLAWNYRAEDIPENQFASFVTNLDESFRGLSVTMPNKVNAFQLCNDRDFFSEVTGSTNTLLFDRSSDGELLTRGFNTDVYGIVRALGDVGVDSARRVSIIGSGATAASAVVAAAELGAEHVSVVARNTQAAQELVQVAQKVGVSLSLHALDQMTEIDACDVAVCTVPGTAELSLESLPRNPYATLLDVAYSPWPSSRATQWNVSGGQIVSGLRMLARQALIQVRIFVSGNPAVELPHEDLVYQAMCASINLEPLS